MINNQRKNRCGFSLIELSIWITIIGLILASLLSWLTPQVAEEADKMQITIERLNKIERALEAYRVYNGRLPCAAKNNISDTVGTAYEEDCVATNGQNVGIVPAKTLGLDVKDALDGWGRRFTYQVATSICGTDPSGLPANCSSSYYKCGASGLSINSCPEAQGNLTVTDSATTTATDVAVYVLLSHGPNGTCAWTVSGTQITTTTCLEVGAADNIGADENYILNDTNFYVGNYGAVIDAQVFDDIVRYKTKDQIEYSVLSASKPVLPEDANNTIESADPVIASFYRDYIITCRDSTAFDGTVNSVEEAVMFSINAQATIDADATIINYMSPFTPSQRVMSVLWHMQEVCANYYSSQTRRCPGNRTYHNINRGCAPL